MGCKLYRSICFYRSKPLIDQLDGVVPLSLELSPLYLASYRKILQAAGDHQHRALRKNHSRCLAVAQMHPYVTLLDSVVKPEEQVGRNTRLRLNLDDQEGLCELVEKASLKPQLRQLRKHLLLVRILERLELLQLLLHHRLEQSRVIPYLLGREGAHGHVGDLRGRLLVHREVELVESAVMTENQLERLRYASELPSTKYTDEVAVVASVDCGAQEGVARGQSQLTVHTAQIRLPALLVWWALPKFDSEHHPVIPVVRPWPDRDGCDRQD